MLLPVILALLEAFNEQLFPVKLVSLHRQLFLQRLDHFLQFLVLLKDQVHLLLVVPLPLFVFVFHQVNLNILVLHNHLKVLDLMPQLLVAVLLAATGILALRTLFPRLAELLLALR